MARDADCIFCRIAAGSIPAHRIWESPAAVAFLDVNPLAEGHVLLIPRDHFRDLRDLPVDTAKEVLSAAPALCDAVMRATGATGVNFLQNTGASSGQAVFHVHFHFIPRSEGDGLGYRWNAGQYPAGRADEIREALVQALR